MVTRRPLDTFAVMWFPISSHHRLRHRHQGQQINPWLTLQFPAIEPLFPWWGIRCTRPSVGFAILWLNSDLLPTSCKIHRIIISAWEVPSKGVLLKSVSSRYHYNRNGKQEKSHTCVKYVSKRFGIASSSNLTPTLSTLLLSQHITFDSANISIASSQSRVSLLKI